MLALDSSRWSELTAAGGNTSLVPRLIQSAAADPRTNQWDELWEQLSHQWTGYSVAFAAVPHVVAIGLRHELTTDPAFLLGLGRTVDSLATLGSPPADLAGDYEAALRDVWRSVEVVVRSSGMCRDDHVFVLHAASALSGRRGLGTLLFLSLYASEPELHCSECDHYLLGQFADEGLAFKAIGSRSEPLSEDAWVRPRDPNDSTDDDFNWLIGLCRDARQDELLREISMLYGVLACPICGAEIDVIRELLRSSRFTMASV